MILSREGIAPTTIFMAMRSTYTLAQPAGMIPLLVAYATAIPFTATPITATAAPGAMTASSAPPTLRMKCGATLPDSSLPQPAAVTHSLFGPATATTSSTTCVRARTLSNWAGFYMIPAQAAKHLPANVPPKALSHLMQSFSDLNIETIDINSDTVVDSSVIHFDANNSVTVVGVTGLTAADFHFVA